MMVFYSIIVPVYNRPDHMKSFLECLVRQGYKDFEVIVVESGSSVKSDRVVENFKNELAIKYIMKENDGQGFSRNRGMKEASGNYFIIFDSDILIPDNYLETLDNHLKNDFLDAYGGPDRLHPNSSKIQVAINFCMTSFLTTGGTRGNKSNMGKYYPRSFNMGVSREVYEKVGGFDLPFLGEDIEYSHRIRNAGFKIGLIEKAYVNHERKSSLQAFYKQIHFFGRARINISTLIPQSFKLIHAIPLFYCAYSLMLVVLQLTSKDLAVLVSIPLIVYNLIILISATIKTKDLCVGIFSVLCTNSLMLAYCTGMIKEFNKLYILKQKQTYST